MIIANLSTSTDLDCFWIIVFTSESPSPPTFFFYFAFDVVALKQLLRWNSRCNLNKCLSSGTFHLDLPICKSLLRRMFWIGLRVGRLAGWDSGWGHIHTSHVDSERKGGCFFLLSSCLALFLSQGKAYTGHSQTFSVDSLHESCKKLTDITTFQGFWHFPPLLCMICQNSNG